MKSAPQQASLPISRGAAQESLRTVAGTLKSKLTNAKYVWLAAAFLFGLNMAVVFSPTFAPRAETFSKPSLGPATSALVATLDQAGMYPAVTGGIEKQAFSPKGAIVAMAGDNIQVFEYPGSIAAQREASAFVEELRADTSGSRAWDMPVSVYSRGTLVIYYLGVNEDILRALDSIAGPALSGGMPAFQNPQEGA